jgi:hypothetical protein
MPGSVEQLDETMKHNGLRWRHELKRGAAIDLNLKALAARVQYRPAEMLAGLVNIPRGEVNRIRDMGDGYVLPITMFERYIIYPAAYLRDINLDHIYICVRKNKQEE